MTIYLACTVRGDRGGVLAGRAICERLQHHGHTVLTTHLLADNVETAEAQITEREVFRRDLERLTACEVLVAEASGSSYGVGFEVGYVLGRAQASGQLERLLRRHCREVGGRIGSAGYKLGPVRKSRHPAVSAPPTSPR